MLASEALVQHDPKWSHVHRLTTKITITKNRPYLYSMPLIISGARYEKLPVWVSMRLMWLSSCFVENLRETPKSISFNFVPSSEQWMFLVQISLWQIFFLWSSFRASSIFLAMALTTRSFSPWGFLAIKAPTVRSSIYSITMQVSSYSGFSTSSFARQILTWSNSFMSWNSLFTFWKLVSKWRKIPRVRSLDRVSWQLSQHASPSNPYDRS